MTERPVLFSASKGIARITLNRPEKLNSVNSAMKQDLSQYLDQVSGDQTIRVLLITGVGRAFCAGQDLTERRIDSEEQPQLDENVGRFWNPLIATIAGLKLPVVCAVNGVAAGAGMNLALACDIVVAARSATFIQSFIKVGLIPDCGGTYFLPRTAGLARAAALAMLGTPITADQAESWGLIWKSVEDKELLVEAETMVLLLSKQPTRGLSLIKQALQTSYRNTLDQQLRVEMQLQGLAGQTSDYREGISAFLEKRDPVFTGQ